MKSWLPPFRRTFSSSLYRLDDSTLVKYSTDAWLASSAPEVVCFPKNVKQVSDLLKFAHQYQVPVTARGAGKGYVGGCVPVKGGIVLSLEKMNRILEINPEDGVAVVEPGVITGVLQDAVKKKGLFYPPDPASLKDCFIGGNVATNAGGPRCLKYGVTRNYVLGLEVVLADGTIVNVGGRTMKNKTGFDLVGLFVGSEGLLGIVTKITVRLIPHPPTRGAICAFFESPLQAARGVQLILKSGLLPATLEVADKLTLSAARQAMGSDRIPPSNAYLLVETDGTEKGVRADLKSVEKILSAL
ncbi:MAG: FAD-binding protein, partial [Verrucomicrobiota bacterium]